MRSGRRGISGVLPRMRRLERRGRGGRFGRGSCASAGAGEIGETIEQGRASCGPGAASGWYWHRHQRELLVHDALERAVVAANVADAASRRKRRLLDHEAVVLARHLDRPGAPVDHRVVGAAVPELELARRRAEREARELVAEADAERPAPGPGASPPSRARPGPSGSGRRGRSRARPRPGAGPARPRAGVRAGTTRTRKPARAAGAGCCTSRRSRTPRPGRVLRSANGPRARLQVTTLARSRPRACRDSRARPTSRARRGPRCRQTAAHRPRSRRWRVSARVSMPEMPGTPRSASRSVQPALRAPVARVLADLAARPWPGAHAPVALPVLVVDAVVADQRVGEGARSARSTTGSERPPGSRSWRC